MEESGDVRPRRALPPRDDDDTEDTPDLLADEDAAATGRFWAPTSGDAPGLDAGTPIPPPAVLPSSADLPPGTAGRRFSADDFAAADVERPLPRRSAVSPTASRAVSPDEADAVAAMDAAEEAVTGAEAEASVAGDRDATGGGASASTDDAGKRRRALLIALAAVVALAIVVGAFAWSQGRSPQGSATPTPTVDPVATYLAQPEDLAQLLGTTWATVDTLTAVEEDSPKAACLLPTAELDTRPADTLLRAFAPTAGATAGALHEVARFATPEEATDAYGTLLGQLATCPAETAWAETGFDVTGLADEASAVAYVVQDAASEYHALLLARTGTRVNIVDVTSPDGAAPMDAVAGMLATVATRQCTDNGACPDAVAVAVGAPPVSDPPGWLAEVDLPRITPGAGTWRGTDIPAIGLAGTRCEAVDLNAVAATSGQQRTYLLADDTNAPSEFGVDEAIWTFENGEAATAFAETLWANIEGCPTRTATATVEKTSEFEGVGKVKQYTVTQRVDENDTTARFRTSVIARDQRVVYLLANPSATFDFSNEAWQAIATRAGQRLTQLP